MSSENKPKGGPWASTPLSHRVEGHPNTLDFARMHYVAGGDTCHGDVTSSVWHVYLCPKP